MRQVIMGIESSCDESAVAIIEVIDGKVEIKQHLIATHDHSAYGGVVPESAARQHFFFLPRMIEKLKNNYDLSKIDFVATTTTPGLVGGLMMGASVGKAVAVALDKPFYPIHHIYAHALSPMIENAELQFPYICLVVSGGHTVAILLKDFGDYTIILKSRDDAMGELFDKVAHYMGLGFPGGPMIEKLAREGDCKRFHFPMPKCKNVSPEHKIVKKLKNQAFQTNPMQDFSFSGLKTAFIREIDHYKDVHGELDHQFKCDIAASLQDVVSRVCKQKLDYLAQEYEVKQWAIAGGVASNEKIRQTCLQVAAENQIQLLFPSKVLCTDNAVMIAWVGFLSWKHGVQPDLCKCVSSSE